MKLYLKRILQRNKKIDKENSYFSAIYNGWIQTRLEQDKSILTLSTSAIGLLTTLLITQKSVAMLDYILFIISILAFVVSSLVTIHIFGKNSNLLEAISNNSDIRKEVKSLDRYDRLNKISFYIGIIFTFMIAINYGIKKISEDNMAQQKQPLSKIVKTDMKKSLSGFQNLKPVTGNKPSGNAGDSKGNDTKKK